MKKVLLVFVIVSVSGLYAQLAADDESGRGTTAVTSTEEQPVFDPQMVQKSVSRRSFGRSFILPRSWRV